MNNQVTNHIFDRRLVPEMGKELVQLHNKIANQFENGERFEYTNHKKYVEWMPQKKFHITSQQGNAV